ncbi:Hypothetical predicted protein [Pelobates cultripes]|nr:Hypothetical predicted protein [Pelobates cultripes]
MKKHAKKANLSYMQLIHSLKIPIVFDFESDDTSDHEADRFKRSSNIQEDKQNITQRSRSLTSTTCVQKPKDNVSTKQVVRPFSASVPTKHHKFAQEEINSNKRAKTRHKSAIIRRRFWKSEIERIPNLATLCQQECKLPVMSILGHRESSLQSSFVSQTSRVPTVESTHSEKSAGLFGIHNDMVVTDCHTLQNWETDGKVTSTQPPEQAVSQQDVRHIESFYHAEKQCVTPIDSCTFKERHIVSLSIEEEFNKPNNKILTVRNPMSAANIQNISSASETVPVIFDNNYKHGSCGILHKDFSSNTISLNRTNEAWLNSNLDNVNKLPKDKHAMAPKLSSKRNKKVDTMLMVDTKVNIHFLSADGTTQVAEVTKDGKMSMPKKSNFRNPSVVTSEELQSSSKSTSTHEMKQETDEVGPIINGVNPRKGAVEELSLYTRPAPSSRSICSNRSKSSTRSKIQRPISEGEVGKWSYISITKTLTPGGCPLSSSPRYKSSPVTSPKIAGGLEKNIPNGLNSTVPLTTKSVLFKNRRERLISILPEIISQHKHPSVQRTKETKQFHNKVKTGQEQFISTEFANVQDAPTLSVVVTPSSDAKIPLNAFSKKESEVISITSVYPDAFPVINIPTAHTDATE